jgi:hypothetical protein
MKRSLVAIVAGLTLLAGLAVLAAATTDNSSLYWFDDSSAGAGTHTGLDRGRETVNVHLRGLPASHAMTIWAVVFEEPQYCDGADVYFDGELIVPGSPGCGGDDVERSFLGDNDVDLSIMYAAGGVTNKGGNLNVKNGIGGGQYLIGTNQIANPDTAEVHFVVRTHGPDQPGDEDTTTFGGGCLTFECADIQFSVHHP